MAAVSTIKPKTEMSSRWRRRRMCILIADHPSPAALRDISGAGALIETKARPAIGSIVGLRHPDAGEIDGEVAAVTPDGVYLALAGDAAAVAFALIATAADMTRG